LPKDHARVALHEVFRGSVEGVTKLFGLRQAPVEDRGAVRSEENTAASPVPSSALVEVELVLDAPPKRVGRVALDEELSKQVFVTEAAMAAGVMLQDAMAEEADRSSRPEAGSENTDELTGDEEGLALAHSSEVQEVYGDGLSLLLRQLLDSRQSSVSAWLALKGEVEGTEAAARVDWTNLSTLEEDFVLINNEHIRGSGAAVAAAR